MTIVDGDSPGIEESMDQWDQCFGRVTSGLMQVSRPSLNSFVEILRKASASRNTVFVIGNGGSSSAASHFAQDIARAAYEGARKQLRVVCLSDNVPLMSGLANDVGYELVFERQLRQFGFAGDVLVAISGSGNSPNIVNAVQYALKHELRVVGVTGFDGGGLKRHAHCCVHVPINDMGVAESTHSAILHAVTSQLRESLMCDDGAIRIVGRSVESELTDPADGLS